MKRRKHTHMRMLSGSPRARKSEQNLFTEASELRSVSNINISASGLSFCITSFTSAAFFKSLAGITILTLLLANTLAVSTPMPDVAPVNKNQSYSAFMNRPKKKKFGSQHNQVTSVLDTLLPGS